MKTGILLVNLGTPDSPSVKDVRKYLREFLSDPRVIDVSPLSRWLLVNFIISPFRAPRSAKLYKEIWDENGSPLLYHSVRQKELLQQRLAATMLSRWLCVIKTLLLKECLKSFDDPVV